MKKSSAGDFGDSPKMEEFGKLTFSEIKRELLYLCFDTILVYFGPQGDAQCVHQYHIRENRKSLGPPPLFNKGVFYRFSEAFYPLRRVFHFTEISSHLKKNGVLPV